MRKLTLSLVAAALAGVAAHGAEVKIDSSRLSPFHPLPPVVESTANPLSEAKVNLGRMLYYEPRLSRDGKTSCNSCHPLAEYGVDHERFSTGFEQQKGGRNAPTVYNAAGHTAQFWDGRAADVEEQAKGPVMNPVEMAMPDERTVVARLKSVPAYVAEFQKAFPGQADPVTFDNMARAIGAFERRLLTPSRWDRFLRGDQNALTAEEKAGFVKFTDTGCQTCHMGPYVGGQMFQKLGLAAPFPNQADKGRVAVTRQAADTMVFKVPSLRNIDKTAPYFHDGSAKSLETAVRDMAKYQLGKQLSDADVRLIAAWLKSLTGQLPVEYIRRPELPKAASLR